MPTYAEWQELHENCTCTWTWTRLNGVNGYLVTSTKDGFTDRSLFLPAAGCRSGSGFSRQGSLGYYWSASLFESYPGYASGYLFNESSLSWNNYNGRYRGLSVRPVSE